MTIASRTPEGSPQQCPICGKFDFLERSDPTGEFICPSCGSLFHRLRDRLGEEGVVIEQLALGQSLRELGLDSLGIVELIMALEEEFQITSPDDVGGRVNTTC